MVSSTELFQFKTELLSIENLISELTERLEMMYSRLAVVGPAGSSDNTPMDFALLGTVDWLVGHAERREVGPFPTV